MFEDYKEREQYQSQQNSNNSNSKPLLNKISMGQLSFMAKSRLYSLMERHENDEFSQDVSDFIDQNICLNTSENEMYDKSQKEF